MTSFSRTWNASYEAVPADTDNVSEGALRIRNLKADIHERLAVDHSWAGDANDGAHLQITLLERAGNPVSAANTGFLYTKDVAGVTELFYEDQGGTVLQVTSNGKLASGAFPAVLNQALEIALAAAGENLRLTSTGAIGFGGIGVQETAYHGPATPAAGDIIFRLLAQGKDSASNVESYAAIDFRLDDPTNTSEDTSIVFRTRIAGADPTLSSNRMTVGNGVYLSTASPQGAGSMNALSYYVGDEQIFPFSSLTQLTAPNIVGASDRLLIRDVSANAHKWAAAQDVGTIVFLTNQDASNQATLVVDLATYYTEFRHFKLFIDAVVPITDATDFQMRVSTDGGSTYDSTAGNYGYNGIGETSALITNVNNSATLIQLNSSSAGLGTSTGEEFSAEMNIFHPASTAKHPKFTWKAVWRNSTPHITVMEGVGQRYNAQDTTHLQFFMASGNINTGNFRLYGIR